MTNHADLISQLNNGWVARPKRWRGDTHHDFPYGNLDDKATDLLYTQKQGVNRKKESRLYCLLFTTELSTRTILVISVL